MTTRHIGRSASCRVRPSRQGRGRDSAADSFPSRPARSDLHAATLRANSARSASREATRLPNGRTRTAVRWVRQPTAGQMCFSSVERAVQHQRKPDARPLQLESGRRLGSRLISWGQADGRAVLRATAPKPRPISDGLRNVVGLKRPRPRVAMVPCRLLGGGDLRHHFGGDRGRIGAERRQYGRVPIAVQVRCPRAAKRDRYAVPPRSWLSAE